MERLKVRLLKNEKIGSFQLLKFKGVFKKSPLPGNFYMLSDDSDRFFLPRPYSVFDFADNEIYFLIKNVGRFSDYLFNMKKNDEIFLIGPYGNKVKITKKTIFISGGIGFAPLHFHSKFIKDFLFFFGGRKKEEILCSKFIDKGKIFVSTDDGSLGFKGDVVELFLKKIKEINIKDRVIFACGPRQMLKKIKDNEENIKIPIYFYLEERMGCGFGGCKGCSVLTDSGYKFVCKDGPVFLSKEVKFE